MAPAADKVTGLVIFHNLSRLAAADTLCELNGLAAAVADILCELVHGGLDVEGGWFERWPAERR